MTQGQGCDSDSMPSKYKKRKDGLYCTHVTIGKKPNGDPHRKTVYAKTIRELEEKVAELKRQVGLGAVIDSGNITLGEWAETWMNIYKTGVEHNTIKMYRHIVDNYIIASLGTLRLKDIKTMHLQKIVNENKGKTWIVKKIQNNYKSNPRASHNE